MSSTTPPTIAINIDAYGSYARHSALADYLEVAVILGRRVTKASLARAIEDNGWAQLPRRQFQTLTNINDDPDAWADSTFSLLRQRRRILKLEYPFDVSQQSLSRNAPRGLHDYGYLVLLAIAVLHAWQIEPVSNLRLPDMLEALVARALEARGLTVVQMGVHDRDKKSFVEAVVLGGQRLGLEPMTDPRPKKASAKDAGIDTLAGLTWEDGRQAGQWLFIGQATIGQSGTWERKLLEPAPDLWAGYMREPLVPLAFLAVPHHVDDEHLEFLTEARRRLVLDRLRLSSLIRPLQREEVMLIDQLSRLTLD